MKQSRKKQCLHSYEIDQGLQVGGGDLQGHGSQEGQAVHGSEVNI